MMAGRASERVQGLLTPAPAAPAAIAGPAAAPLERLCVPEPGDYVRAAPPEAGIERIEAKFSGAAFSPHRHDTYALGLTLAGAQKFRYRGAGRVSLPGQVIVLHPDEVHDGGAGSDQSLRYRMMYLAPGLVLEAMGNPAAALPFVAEPVIDDQELAATLRSGLCDLSQGLAPLPLDDVLARLARGLVRRAGGVDGRSAAPAHRAVHAVADYLSDNFAEAVDSGALEAVSGLDRFSLARQFRALRGTSPHRFLLMRRLEATRRRLAAGDTLADIAAASGFADQSHLTRHFRAAFGMTPGRWRGLLRDKAVAMGASPGGRSSRAAISHSSS